MTGHPETDLLPEFGVLTFRFLFAYTPLCPTERIAAKRYGCASHSGRHSSRIAREALGAAAAGTLGVLRLSGDAPAVSLFSSAGASGRATDSVSGRCQPL